MLTYEDRLKALREKKIRHTLAKRDQQGFMDVDDYGTVPVPEGFVFEPVSDRPDKGFLGVQGMCDNFCKMMDVHPVYVDPMEILCGRWRLMLTGYRPTTRWDEARFPYDHLKPTFDRYNIKHGIDGDTHFACDYTIGLSLGFQGLLDKIESFRALKPEREAFYEAEARTVRAIVHFITRHLPEIWRLLEKETRPEIRHTLSQMLEANQAILTKPPTTFLEACQWIAWFNCVSRIYDRDGAGCQLDQVLWPYYARDLREGRITREDARFILANLLLVDPHYYQISGLDSQNRDITNALSYLILDAAHGLNISANVTVRVHKDCDPGIVRRGVEYLFTDRNGWPRFCGDEPLVSGYMRNGISKEIARERIAVGCNWMAIPGREYPMQDQIKINLGCVMMAAWSDMMAEKSQGTDRLFALFQGPLTQALAAIAEGVELHLAHAHEVTPELVMNLMMRHTLEEGLDITQCAEFFTIAVDGCALAVAADSFAALEQRVEREGRATWQEVAEALETDFAGVQGERLRLMLSTSERYCQGNTLGDAWAARITEAFSRIVRAQPMAEGRSLVPGWFSWSQTIELGKRVGATPNGRRAGTPISHGANPNPGFRKDGAATAMATGIAHVQPGYGNTAPLQLEFDPQVSREAGGIERVERLIRTHFDLGGTLININVLDKEKVMAAHQNPDLHPDLVVRVTGFTAYFATLSPEFRQLVVDRFVEGF